MTEDQWNKWKKIAERIEELTNIDLHAGTTVQLQSPELGNVFHLVNSASIDESSFLDSDHTIQFGYDDGEEVQDVYLTVFKVTLPDDPKKEEWEVDPDAFLKLIKVYKTVEVPFSLDN